MSPTLIAEFFGIGVVASIFGSIVGLGGGFVTIPLLRIGLGISPSMVAGTSLLFVFANVASSAIGYIRQKRVDFGLGVPIAIGAVPGSIAGALAVKHAGGTLFDVAYGSILIVVAILVVRRRSVASRPANEKTFVHTPWVGVAAGVLLGVLSSLFGIGGGVVMIPLLLIAARLPPHIVTATSAFVVAITSPVGIIAHAISGDIAWAAGAPLIVGGVIGGALAPPISARISSPGLINLLAVALVVAALGLALRHFI